ncbi:Paired immunoglobulin-like type 2 receptor beta-2 [Microtus ochrogaster]|nr:Paired immunoglobulin-like type 2 receptor beta-2 [Microtus ochrogaster]
MAWFLLLLLPAACLQAGNSAGSNRVNTFGVNQPARLSGVEGSSVEIPFSFYFPWELAKDPQMRILWRRKYLYGELIYNSSSGFIHEHFKDQLILNWTQPQTLGVLRILDLNKKDQTVYFCQIYLNTKRGVQSWQSTDGTQLAITHAVSTTMQSPSIVTSAITTAGLEDTEGQRNPSLESLGATVRVVVATAVLITPVYVILIFLWWQKREQLRGRQRISMAATLTLVLLLQDSKLKLKPQPGEQLSSQGAGNSAGSNRVNDFGVNQTAHLSGVQGSSIEIPFSFYYPWKSPKDLQMRILWRWKHFHGAFIYKSSSGFIHKHFKNRLILNWTQPQTSGVLRILDLKKKDQAVYFCRVHLKARKVKEEFFQSIPGTNLSITPRKHMDPNENPKDNNIVYASIALTSPTSPGAPACPPVHENPQEETVYSIVKTK